MQIANWVPFIGGMEISRPTSTKTHDQQIMASAMERVLASSEGFSVGGGRTTAGTGNNVYDLLQSEMAMITPDFPLEMLKLCEHLAKYNGDISYAVDNIVQLGNTPTTISFDDSVNTVQAQEMVEYLVNNEDSLYNGGMNSLQNDLFAQCAITGVLSAEGIPNRKLNGIAQVVIVNPYYIRFKYNPRTYRNEPYQQPPNPFGFAAAAAKGGLIKLNENQYKYYALRTFSGNPTGIPPMMSAMESLELDKDMMKNMKAIIRKLGAFGFLNVLLTAPRRKQNETDDAYFIRCEAYIAKVRPEIEKGFASGLAIGYKGAIEYDMEATNANVQGARELLNMITERVHAGVKQDPLMLGRNFNVAETMAKVIMAKLTTQVGNYQRLVATFRGDIYLMMLRMAGYKLNKVTVEYEPPMIGDKLREEQAFKAKIENRITLRDKGIIDQQETAQQVGYGKAHADKDVDYSVPSAAEIAIKKAGSAPSPGAKDPNASDDATSEGATNYTTAFLHDTLHRGTDEYRYTDEGCNCGHSGTVNYAGDKGKKAVTVDDYVLLYNSAMNQVYKSSIDRASLKIGEALAELGQGATLETVTDRVYNVLYREWNASFTVDQTAIINKWVQNIYNYFRQDTSYMVGKDIPAAVFDLYDIRALTYFQNSDALYLGKFITDKDTRKKITEYIKEKYLRDNTPIGNNTAAIEDFKAGFEELMGMENWKIRRIIDTSVNQMRNSAAVNFMQQAGVLEFEVRGVRDARQCGYCASLQGKRFSVGTAFSRTEKWLRTLPEFVSSEKPFVTAAFKGNDGLERFKLATATQIQAAGIDTPPYHSHCRDVIIAVL